MQRGAHQLFVFTAVAKIRQAFSCVAVMRSLAWPIAISSCPVKFQRQPAVHVSGVLDGLAMVPLSMLPSGRKFLVHRLHNGLGMPPRPGARSAFHLHALVAEDLNNIDKNSRRSYHVQSAHSPHIMKGEVGDAGLGERYIPRR